MASVHLTNDQRSKLAEHLANIVARQWPEPSPVISYDGLDAERVYRCWLGEAGCELDSTVKMAVEENRQLSDAVSMRPIHYVVVHCPDASREQARRAGTAQKLRLDLGGNREMIGRSTPYSTLDMKAEDMPPDIYYKVVMYRWQRDMHLAYRMWAKRRFKFFFEQRKTYGQVKRDWPELINYVPSSVKATLRSTVARGPKQLTDEYKELIPELNKLLAIGMLIPDPAPAKEFTEGVGIE